jgi:hypothetical protein
MPNTRFENYVLENRLSDQLETRMNMLDYVTVNDQLATEAGMTVKVHAYVATGAAEKLEEGEGNSQSVEMSYSTKEYKVGTTQAHFVYTDEDEMADPFLVDGGVRNLSVAITNSVTNDVIAEFGKASLVVYYSGAPKFDDFVDALGMLTVSDNAAGSEDEPETFALVNRKSKALVQKGLKDDLKYVEDYARQGYIGHVAGVAIRVNDAVPEGWVIIATKEAVTYFRKKAATTEQEREGNTRKNTLYGRLVGFAALTDEGKCAILKPAT